MAHPKLLFRALLATAALGGCATNPSLPPPLELPFEFTASQVMFQARAGGLPLTVMLDTAVDPSALDSAAAKALGVQSGAEQAGDGFGSGTFSYRPAILEALSIRDQSFGPVEVAVGDLSALASRTGGRLDAILGYSFLKDHPVLIDYPANRLTIFSGRRGAEPAGCRQRYRFPVRFLSDEEKIILIPGLRIGGTEILARLDTGSARGLLVDAESPAAAAIRPFLPRGRTDTAMGFRGSATVERGPLRASAILGPFRLEAADTTVTMDRTSQAPVNIGNGFLRAIGVQLLVDIPAGKIGLYRSCSRTGKAASKA